MRLHHLRVVGFGPFADPVSIDFDALSDAGLFLLSGPTGAGKSSILDAVCFALYGDVPGDRSAAKRLRSDHAADDVAPRVVLEATLSGRRFRIDRSPAWTRLKKRGTGTTTEQARVVIAERRPADDGQHLWHPLSTRLDETGHLVTRLVGMTLPQFCQVAMLPQGRFQAFLRARSEERHALLQQVFQTGRFDRTERWLRDRRVALRRDSETHRSTVADLVSRVSEVGDDQAPDDWQADPAVLDGWATGLGEAAASASAAQATLTETLAAAETAAAVAESAGVEPRGAPGHPRRSPARPGRAGCRRPRARGPGPARRSGAARRRGAFLHDLALASSTAADEIERRHHAALAELAELVGAPTTDDDAVAEHHRAATRVLDDLARVRPLRRQAAELQARLDRTTAARHEVTAELDRLAVREQEVPQSLADLEPRLTAARDAAAEVATLDRELEVVRSRVLAARSAEELATELTAAQLDLAAATQTRLLAREALVEIREQRLDGMAAEIARKLAVGACCPVCGSADHPSPAAPASGAPDEATERDARREVDDLEVVVEAHAQQVRGLETRLATARAEAGDTIDRLVAAEADVLTRAAAARAAAATVAPLVARHDALLLERDDLARQRDALTSSAAQLDTETAVLDARLEALAEQVRAVVPDDADLDALTAHHQQVEDLARRCTDTAADLRRARTTAESTQQAADRAAADAGFVSSTEAAAAWLSDADLAALLATIDRHERELARTAELLGDDDLVRAAAAPAPDLVMLADAHRRAEEAAAAARHRDLALRERVHRLGGLTGEVRSALDAWAPVRSDLDLVADLAALVEGKHPDNRHQMRLSAYVLAHRLGQVVEAANLRLSTMSDRRYSLVHTGQRGAGETRGGLSLLVRDDWTGDSRDPATLSGGETFVVSLALALGLADVITQEAGGADLDTLFVDEGFGSLDAETLEDVMDTLDTLRDGGRVVGVVSHVPELQTRIPTQLRVHRGRTGSHTSLSLA
ncbi:AAA family ATPase [Nocardioides sp. T5]|uniref:AAA family ATPase n=1 Tax=Nocardioides sp. T5 TaxID=3400182 RepID=UPI003A889BD4